MRHLIALTLFVATLLSGVAIAGPLTAGGATRPITPFDLNGIWIAGFGTGRAAQGVHDDLWARAFVVNDGNEEICIAVVDLIGYMVWRIDDLKDELVQRGFKRKNIIISSTHNHESPDAMGLWGESFGQSGVKSSYLDYVDQQILAAIDEARATQRPAGLRFGLGQAGDWAWDFRDPVVIDDDIHGMQAVDLDGNIIFTALHYGQHPEVLWSRNVYLTADFPGFLCQRLEQEHGGAPGIYINGHLGGLISPKVPDVFGDDNYSFTFARRYGEQIADVAIQALENQPVHYDLNITTDMRTLDIQIDNQLFILGARVGTFEVPLQYILDRNYTIPADVHVMRFGDVATFANVPGEMFPEVGMEIDDALPGQYKMTINLGNNQLGYLIPPIDFMFPDDPFNAGDNYEETVSPGIGAVPQIQSAIFSMIGHPTPTPFHSPTPSPTPSPTLPPMSPTPTPTATFSPTPTPTATIAPTPTPGLGEPTVLLGGMWNSNLSEASGGVFSVAALIGGQPQMVNFIIDGLSAGSLPEIKPGFHGLLDVPIEPGLPARDFRIEIQAIGPTDGLTRTWPYLEVQ